MACSLPPLLTGTGADLGIGLAGRSALGMDFLSSTSTSLQQESGESLHCTKSYTTGFILRAAPKKN